MQYRTRQALDALSKAGGNWDFSQRGTVLTLRIGRVDPEEFEHHVQEVKKYPPPCLDCIAVVRVRSRT